MKRRAANVLAPILIMAGVTIMATVIYAVGVGKRMPSTKLAMVVNTRASQSSPLEPKMIESANFIPSLEK